MSDVITSGVSSAVSEYLRAQHEVEGAGLRVEADNATELYRRACRELGVPEDDLRGLDVAGLRGLFRLKAKVRGGIANDAATARGAAWFERVAR